MVFYRNMYNLDLRLTGHSIIDQASADGLGVFGKVEGNRTAPILSGAAVHMCTAPVSLLGSSLDYNLHK